MLGLIEGGHSALHLWSKYRQFLARIGSRSITSRYDSKKALIQNMKEVCRSNTTEYFCKTSTGSGMHNIHHDVMSSCDKVDDVVEVEGGDREEGLKVIYPR